MTLVSKKKSVEAVLVKKNQLLKYLEHLGKCKGELFFNEKGYLTFKVSLHPSGEFSLSAYDISVILSSRRRDDYEYRFYQEGGDEILITEEKVKSNRHEARKAKKQLKGDNNNGHQ